MNRLLGSITTLVIAAATATATRAEVATTTLSLTVPVRCSVDMTGGAIVGSRLIVHVRRACNASHDVVLSGQADAALGDVQVRYNNGGGGSLAGDALVLAQPEAYYDGIDTVVIEANGATAEALVRFASTLRVSLVVA